MSAHCVILIKNQLDGLIYVCQESVEFISPNPSPSSTPWQISSSITDVLIRQVSHLFQRHKGGASVQGFLIFTRSTDWLLCFSAYRHKYLSLPWNILWITHSLPTSIFYKTPQWQITKLLCFFFLFSSYAFTLACLGDSSHNTHVIWNRYSAAQCLLTNTSFNFHPMVAPKTLPPPFCHLLTRKPFFSGPKFLSMALPVFIRGQAS